MKILQRLLELTEPEAFWIFWWSCATIVLTAVLLRTRKLPALLQYFSRPSDGRIGQTVRLEPDSSSLDRVLRYSHTIITRILHSRRPCLLRSLVLYRYCWKHGVPASIHFGVQSGTDKLKGHSWVTLNGSPIGEPKAALRPYVTVYSYPIDIPTSVQHVPAMAD